MLTYHSLTLIRREPLAEAAVLLELQLPTALATLFSFAGGQHLPVRAVIEGKDVRRTYSIVGRGHDSLLLGVRVQGVMSQHLAALALGATIEVMPPTGRFRAALDATRARSHVAFASGSGITPVLAIIDAVLAAEPAARVALYYGNKTLSRTMFAEALMALKNRYLGRFTLHFLMSQEQQDLERQGGRLDAATVRRLLASDLDGVTVDEWYVCGPNSMVADLTGALQESGVPGRIHVERFGSSARARPTPAPTLVTDARAVSVTVTMDGRDRQFLMDPQDSVLAAAEEAGLRLPFSCRAGICSTCRTRVVAGAVAMERNQALEDWEVAAGYVLCCQARPTTDKIHITYDEI